MSFDMESSVTYTFQEPFSVMQNRSSQASSVSTESSSRAREDVAFSFVTSQRPAMLLTVSTFSQQYIAVILAKNGRPTYWFYINISKKNNAIYKAIYAVKYLYTSLNLITYKDKTVTAVMETFASSLWSSKNNCCTFCIFIVAEMWIETNCLTCESLSVASRNLAIFSSWDKQSWNQNLLF